MLKFVFNKDAGLYACNFIKKRLQNRYFTLKFAKLLRTSFFIKNTSNGCFLLVVIVTVLTKVIVAVVMGFKYLRNKLS